MVTGYRWQVVAVQVTADKGHAMDERAFAIQQHMAAHSMEVCAPGL
jgi:hypothetical protein